MITDAIIETGSAQYFCLFKDKDFIKKIDQTLSQKNKNKGKKLMAKAVTQSPKKKLDEALFLAPVAYAAIDYLIGAICALGVSYFGGKALTTAINNVAGSRSSSSNSTSSNVDIPPVDPASYSSVQNTVNQISIPYTPHKEFTFKTIDDIATTTKIASQIPTPPKKTPWWKKILGWVGGAVMSFFGWLAAVLAAIGVNITAEALAGICTGIAAISAYLIPRITYWVRRCMKGNIIAEVKFKTTDDNELNCWYSYKDFKWHLNYLGSRLASKTKVSDEDAQSFIETKFFKKFKDECKKTLGNIFNDNDRYVATCSSVLLLKDDNEKDEYKKILESKDQIMNGIENIKIIAG